MQYATLKTGLKTFLSITSVILLVGCFDDDAKTPTTNTSQGAQATPGDCLRYGDVVEMEFSSTPGEPLGVIGHGNNVETSTTHLNHATKFLIGYHNLQDPPSDILVYPLNRNFNDGCLSQNHPITLRNAWGSHMAHDGTGRVVGLQPSHGLLNYDRTFHIFSPTITVPGSKLMLDANDQATVNLAASGQMFQNSTISRNSRGAVISTPVSPGARAIKLTRLNPEDFVYTKAAVFSYNTTSEPCTHGGRLINGDCFIAHKDVLNPSTKVSLIPPTNGVLRWATLTQPGQNSNCGYFGVPDGTTHCVLPNFGNNRNYFIANDSFYAVPKTDKCDYSAVTSLNQNSSAAAIANWNTVAASSNIVTQQGYLADFNRAAARQVNIRAPNGYVASARPCLP